MKSFDVCATIIIYNPENIDNVLFSIDNIIYEVQKVLVIDNSEKDQSLPYKKSIMDRFGDSVIYFSMGGNKGIGKALNMAASVAFSLGFKWLLTMDQDSSFPLGGLERLKQAVLTNERPILLASPVHIGNFGKYDSNIKSTKELQTSYVLTTMTSGNLVHIPTLLALGGYNEAYFIDYVDHEICLKANMNGFGIMIVNNVILKHELGQMKSRYRLWGNNFIPTNHNYKRRYYITRNRLFTIKKYGIVYPQWCIKDTARLLKETVSILLYETEKLEKVKSIIRGIYDFSIGKTGK